MGAPTKPSLAEDFIYPRYERGCISNLPNAILNLFGVKTPKPQLPLREHVEKLGADKASKVVLLLLDGFGFDQFQRNQNNFSFLSNLSRNGSVFPLTSVFPSQTTNALATLNTGLMPQEHGLFEYFIYLKEAGQVVNTLSFEPVGSAYGSGAQTEFDPHLAFNGKTIHTTLKAEGIETFVHAYKYYAFSPCSQLLFDGSTVVPSWKTSDMVVNLRRNLQDTQGPAYFFVHFDTLDTIAHEYGPNSEQYAAELSAISYLLSKELVEKVDAQTAKETLILVTADHGEAAINPQDTLYLNNFPQVISNLKTEKKLPILPAGGPRDVFLHIQEEKLAQTKEFLTKELGKKAAIIETQEAIEQGLFGIGEAAEVFCERAGNLMVLPFANQTVWFEFSQGRKLELWGHHGGLSREEMVVPFGLAKLSSLK
ncbi:MAG: alkaline phosphatase family protein [Candidatus Bathyarchaeia archaeon]|jgi:predicted AlkP superfamily pyrophosphatase or phosphodiesterase